VEILLVMEERGKAHDFAERFKLAVVSATDPQRWVREMFPEWVRPDDSEPTTVGVDEDLDLADTSGQWVFTDTMTPEEILADLATEGQMVGGIADLGGDWIEG
jgi:hypothetical protein